VKVSVGVGAAVVAALLVPPERALAWGDRTHPAIVRLAVETLPDDVAAVFRAQQRKLERYSNEPDSVLRKRHGRQEAIRHFIDLDGYMPAPFDGFPRTYEAAVARIGVRKVEKYGVLPWVVLRMRGELRAALAAGDPGWVRIAGHLAHYVGDAYQPLHLTVDFDGQKSGAKGIHRRFENDVVDAAIAVHEKAIRADLAEAKPLADLRGDLFAALFRSYDGYRTILAGDAAARRAGRPGSRRYETALAAATDDLVRTQLRDAAVMLGSVWLTSYRQGAGDRDR
jgi:hypothetical protein